MLLFAACDLLCTQLTELHCFIRWTQLSGKFRFESVRDMRNLLLTIRGPEAGVDFAIDDVVLHSNPPEMDITFVDSGHIAERVTIPRPIMDDASPYPENCPDDADDLVLWKNAVGSSLTTGQHVTLPEYTSVLINETIPTTLGVVTIPSTSQLIFGRNKNGIAIDVEGFDVSGDLIAGSESCKFETPLVITLHGNRPTDLATNKPPSTYKGISVTGRIELHGKRFFQTWSR